MAARVDTRALPDAEGVLVRAFTIPKFHVRPRKCEEGYEQRQRIETDTGQRQIAGKKPALGGGADRVIEGESQMC